MAMGNGTADAMVNLLLERGIPREHHRQVEREKNGDGRSTNRQIKTEIACLSIIHHTPSYDVRTDRSTQSRGNSNRYRTRYSTTTTRDAITEVC